MINLNVFVCLYFTHKVFIIKVKEDVTNVKKVSYNFKNLFVFLVNYDYYKSAF